MKPFMILSVAFLSIIAFAELNPVKSFSSVDTWPVGNNIHADSLPDVFTGNHADLIESRLRSEAIHQFALHALPKTKKEFDAHQKRVRNEIIKKAGIMIDHKLPLNYQETGVVKTEGITVKNIIFQTRPGVYATANLHIPEGKGPFPAVLNVHGHWKEGRLSEYVQARGHSLALNGYVCLSIDAFGSGERTTDHGTYEYHGANLGSQLMNLGESLLGFQVSDNMRAVDLLTSLPYVDAKNIGVTGASGGGNQTMWVTAIDERIKASMPVVSVGTFESAVMRSNCICELLIDGLTITETSGVLALVAPRAIKMCNHEKDSNPTFYPAEMKRSYNNARPVYKMLGVENKISYQILDLTHGYWPKNREAMLGWFDLHLKGVGTGAPIKEVPFQTLEEEKVMVYPKGKRDPKVASIEEYCKRRGSELKSKVLSAKTIRADQKKNELKTILRINEKSLLQKAHAYSPVDGWDRLALETSDGKLIPVLHMPATGNSSEYVIIADRSGNEAMPSSLLNNLKKKGVGIVVVNLSGTGETASATDRSLDGLHTLSRAELWLGRTVLGEWVKELEMVAGFIKDQYKATKVTIDGTKEAGLAALFLSALDGNIEGVILRDAPISYLFDTRENIDFFNMGVNVPGILVWGDVSLAAALSDKNITFIHPVTMSGNELSRESQQAYQKEFKQMEDAVGKSGKTIFSGL